MFSRSLLSRMPNSTVLRRTRLIARHMSSSAAEDEAPVLFESNGSLRKYILNRPAKHNALDSAMIKELRPKLKEWENSDLCRIVVGTGQGRSFCAGGDVVSVIKDASTQETLPSAVGYFKMEFELDYNLANLKKPYICILNGNTMGGGVGLSAHAPFRIATETTTFAMPETKIGYCPDVGATYFLPRLDGEIGTYLGLTSETVQGRAVFELGLATHFIPSRRVPQLLEALSSLQDPTLSMINSLIEDHHAEPVADEKKNHLVGEIRSAIDTAFRHDSVDMIFDSLAQMKESGSSATVKEWAEKTLTTLQLRSPTSLKVALQAIRRGKKLSLADALRMELGIATAFLTGGSPDFTTGVTSVLIDKKRDERPSWSPSSLSDVSDSIVKQFFDDSPLITAAPMLDIEDESPTLGRRQPQTFGLPSEREIAQVVRGDHPQSGAFSLTVEELIEQLTTITGGKHGLESKVRDVVARRCQEIEEDGKRYLKWV